MNLPNKISLARILLIPVFVAAFFLDGVIPFAYGIAAIIFAVAAMTDFVDGKIARSRGLVTNLGKFLDPIADKVLVSTAMLVMLTMKDSLFALVGDACDAIYVATAICTCIIMARELIISAFRQIAAANGIIMAAEKLGKYKAACQDVAIFFLILAAGLAEFVEWASYVALFGFALFAVATVLTILSGISYVVKNKQVLKDN
jgi:CDP-diacylglycerol--glycerol-3-phosphate 3-phosphatidyltransferase